MITHTIVGLLVMICFYKSLKLLGNLINLISQLRSTIAPKSLREELNELTDLEFEQWCLEYLSRRGYKLKNENSGIKAYYKSNIFNVIFMKENKMDDNIVSILIGKQLLVEKEKILLITNKKLSITDEELKKLAQYDIKIIDGSYFDETYEEYVRNRILTPNIEG